MMNSALNNKVLAALLLLACVLILSATAAPSSLPPDGDHVHNGKSNLSKPRAVVIATDQGSITKHTTAAPEIHFAVDEPLTHHAREKRNAMNHRFKHYRIKDTRKIKREETEKF